MKVFIIISVFVILGVLTWQIISFNQSLKAGREVITQLSVVPPRVLGDDLPPILKNYLSKVVLMNDPSLCRYVSFHQHGLFRMKPTDKMSGFTATQMISLVAPMFSWEANIKVSAVPVKVCDRLVDGKGELEARLFGVIPVAKATGPELLRGELLRYLAELPWYPIAIINQPLIQWQQVSDSKLIGTLEIDGVKASVEYTFEDGLIKSIYVPDRGMTVGSKSIPTPWVGKFSKYQRVGHMMIPTYGEVSWILPEGEFTYFKGNITDYNIACSNI